MATDQLFQEAASTIIKSGFLPMEITDTVIELMHVLLTEEQADLVRKFKKPMQMDEIKKAYGLETDVLERILNELMTTGVIMGVPNRTSGVVTYRLMPILPGIFEYTMMRGSKEEKDKKLAQLYDKIFDEFTDLVQDNYDDFLPVLKAIPPITRVIPVNTTVEEAAIDTVYPLEDVMLIVDKFDTVAVAHCYCRVEKDLLDKPCQVTNERKNCLLFGQTAQFAINYKFGEEISKEKAKEILIKSSEDGLVHKTFHKNQDIEKDEFALCNCCKCCCQTFGMYYRGMAPSHNYSSHLAIVNDEECIACEQCIEACPLEMISLTEDGDSVSVNEAGCIGCGVCAVQCPNEAIKLKRTERRAVFIAPHRR